MSQFIFIDGSYFIFYRYFSLVSWYRNAKKELPLNPSLDKEFVDRFKKRVENTIIDISGRFAGGHAKIFVAKDCARENIWRTALYPDYKAGRKDIPEIGPFFKLVYTEKLFEKAGCEQVLELDQLEADDCIALAIKNWSYDKAIIVASDKDYLQLFAPERVNLFDLKFKPLSGPSIHKNNAELDLFCKILTGDVSDNIKPVFKKCGPVTATKLFWNKDLLHKRFCDNEGSRESFEFNSTLIDFNKIPMDLQTQFLQKYVTY